ncbi:hypothetical protein HMPREF1508_0490 [Shuttleworthella sp. MSX8B]|uniref:Uncharacterized protein n=1 Tax=Shuttleworthella satelles DSM 14600 TaxID=626523 RepID=C4GCS3_9FIRM|nr:hypothetical protein GCWU000342_01767 [Shuttleworthia satelles DSM 14600]EUB12967.1 hypothetical protein HMPREF1508_0490 [Shuttleworthia sp. MSX8B]
MKATPARRRSEDENNVHVAWTKVCPLLHGMKADVESQADASKFDSSYVGMKQEPECEIL